MDGGWDLVIYWYLIKRGTPLRDSFVEGLQKIRVMVGENI
jgi:hypothetical protein